MYRLFLFLNLITLSAYAQSELFSESEELKTLNQNIYEPNYFSLLFGLAFVIALIYITGIVYQKLIKVKLSTNEDEANRINIVSTTSLGQGKNLHIIKVNNSYSLIGATANNISHLKDFSKEEIENFSKENNKTN